MSGYFTAVAGMRVFLVDLWMGRPSRALNKIPSWTLWRMYHALDIVHRAFRIYDDEYWKNTADLDLQKTVFKLAQFVGATGTMYICRVLLDPYIRGSLFVTFWVDLGCMGRAIGPNRIFSACFWFVKSDQYEPCVSKQIYKWPHGCPEHKCWILGSMGYLAVISLRRTFQNLKVRHSIKNIHEVSNGPEHSKTEFKTPMR